MKSFKTAFSIIFCLLFLTSFNSVKIDGVWSEWTQDGCFKNIFVRSRLTLEATRSHNKQYESQIRSSYTNPVHLSFEIWDSNQPAGYLDDGRVWMQPGEIHNVPSDIAGDLTVKILDLRFCGQDANGNEDYSVKLYPCDK